MKKSRGSLKSTCWPFVSITVAFSFLSIFTAYNVKPSFTCVSKSNDRTALLRTVRLEINLESFLLIICLDNFKSQRNCDTVYNKQILSVIRNSFENLHEYKNILLQVYYFNHSFSLRTITISKNNTKSLIMIVSFKNGTKK